METKGPPSHGGLSTENQSALHWLTPEDKVWDVSTTGYPAASITAVNVCSHPRVKANKLFNKKLYPGPNMLSLYTKRPESHCEEQCLLLSSKAGSSCVEAVHSGGNGLDC